MSPGIYYEKAICPMGIRVDSKRRKKLMQKRLAMGHKRDDHEQEQGYNLDIR